MKKESIKFDDGKYYDCAEMEQSDFSKQYDNNWDKYGYDDTCVVCCKPVKAPAKHFIIGVCGSHNTWMHPKYGNIDFYEIDGGYLGHQPIGSDCYNKLPKEFKEYVHKGGE